MIGALLVAVTFSVMCWLAASRLICPTRRTVQDYHRELIDQPAAHGLQIRAFTLTGDESVKNTPCLLCEPIASPGIATKGNTLRSQLSADGLPLRPWGEIIGTLVLLHGHNGCKEDHLPVAERLCAAGFRCILIDLPGHGANPRPFASFGFRETHLPAAALDQASQQFHFLPQPAGLFGISQGGAIVLQAASADPQRWKAVAELSSFAELDAVITNQAHRWFGPFQSPARAIVSRLVKWRAGFEPATIRPIDAAIKLTTMPVLIGHGDADTFVTPDHAKRLFDATPSTSKQFLTISAANHHNVLITAQPVYATLAKFFWSALAP